MASIPSDLNRDTEVGKIQFISFHYKRELEIVYKYLSQIHHYSNKATMLYSRKMDHGTNQMYSLLIIHIVGICLIDIMNDIYPHEVCLGLNCCMR
jgi:hypothetical protein